MAYFSWGNGLEFENYESLKMNNSYRWLVTGAAGFIGSHIAERLLSLGQVVIGLDNFSTGSQNNIEALSKLSKAGGGDFFFERGDIRDTKTVANVVKGVDFILHHAAAVSVSGSVNCPLETHDVNTTGFFNILNAARNADVRKVIYASSSAVYGDALDLPKVEHQVGNLLSPYAATKLTNETYAQVFHHSYGLSVIGLRYFNIFGPRQRPDGPYAAVIPKWVDAMKSGVPIEIYGDGDNTRDFCFISNVVDVNVIAALSETASGVFNVGCGRETSLGELFLILKKNLMSCGLSVEVASPKFSKPRKGDIKRSVADISRLRQVFDYVPKVPLEDGLKLTVMGDLRNTSASLANNSAWRVQ